MKVFPLLAIVTLSVVYIVQASATDKVICYYGSWATYRSGNGKVAVEDLDTQRCTHLIYTFVGLNSDASIKILDEYLEISLDNLNKFTNLKKKNPNLKTIIAIGGWNAGGAVFSAVAADAAKTKTFAKNALDFVQKYNFDGFDLDWEYPGGNGGSYNDKNNLERLLKTFRDTFDASGNKYLLSAAVAATNSAISSYYDVPALNKYLDFINVMTYDLHMYSEGVTGQNSPLYASSIDTTSYAKELNADACIQAWIKNGASPSKIVLGLAVYGRSFTLQSASNNKLGAPTVSYYGGNAGPYTQESGFLGYHEICEEKSKGGWTEVWDDEQKVPYMYKGNQWIGFDNEKSVKSKVEYAIKQQLGGVMIWSIETDDPSGGACGKSFPILKAIREALGDTETENNEVEESFPESEPDREPAPQPAPEPAPEPAPSDTECTKSGFIRDSANCNVFYECVANRKGGYTKYQFNCYGELVFNTAGDYCDYTYNVEC